MDVITLLVLYFVIMNLIGLFIMGYDKWQAQHYAWRVPELNLFIIALIGGSIGSIIGMYLFHHKTRHWYFVYGMPAILILQLLIAIILWQAPLQFQFM